MWASFGIISAKYDINRTKSYLLTILGIKRVIETTVIKNTNQFPIKLRDILVLDLLNLFGGATSFEFLLKAYNTKETKNFFTYEWFISQEKLNAKELPSYAVFFSILRNSHTTHIPLDKDKANFEILVKIGLSKEQALSNLWEKNIPPIGAEN